MKRIIDGGSWDTGSEDLLPAYRYGFNGNFRFGSLGLRLVEGFPGSCQVIRGNSWINGADNFRLPYRDNRPRSIHDYDLGFRLMEDL